VTWNLSRDRIEIVVPRQSDDGHTAPKEGARDVDLGAKVDSEIPSRAALSTYGSYVGQRGSPGLETQYSFSLAGGIAASSPTARRPRVVSYLDRREDGLLHIYRHASEAVERYNTSASKERRNRRIMQRLFGYIGDNDYRLDVRGLQRLIAAHVAGGYIV
jgi:hypothetical protein